MRLPYGSEDDVAAYEFVSNEIKRPNADRWSAMTCADDRVLQTGRALMAIIKSTEISFVQRKAEITAARADFLAKRISAAERALAVAEYDEWKIRAVAFLASVKSRYEQIKRRVRQLNGDETLELTKSALLTLAQAVADHQASIEAASEPKTEDRLLWLRLETLRCPIGPYGFRSERLSELTPGRN